MSDKKIYVIKTENRAIPANGNIEFIIETDCYKPLGYFSLQVVLAGGGTCDVTYSVSNDPAKVAFTDPTDIIIGAVEANVNFSTFEPPVCKYIKVKIEESAGTAVTANVYIAAQ